MASALKDALPARLKPSNGEAEGRHHGKSQSHVVSFPLIHSVVLSSRERRWRRRAAGTDDCEDDDCGGTSVSKATSPSLARVTISTPTDVASAAPWCC